MIVNYFKLAVKVLRKNKFYSFIVLFGICFTLLILLLASAFLDSELSNNAPLGNKDRILLVPMMKQKKYTTIREQVIDTLEEEGIVKYDTSFTETKDKENFNSISTGPISYDFIRDHMGGMTVPQELGMYSPSQSITLWVSDRKLKLTANYVDDGYWRIFNFDYIEGNPFTVTEFENQTPSVVITQETAKSYFGQATGVVGMEMKSPDRTYKVVGVVKRSYSSAPVVRADIFLPLSLQPESLLNSANNHGGITSAVLMAANNSDIPKMKDELRVLESQVPMPDPERFDFFELEDLSLFDRYAVQMLGYKEDSPRNLRWIIIGFFTFFSLLPLINLIALNVSRIMERAPEIGVRKSFGAKKNQLLFQFIFENVIITALGGILALILAVICIYFLNNAEFIGDRNFRVNYRLFLYAFMIIIVFGVLSGFIPAYRMAKLNIAPSLKQNAL